ncbi:Uncharacterized protein HZ326_30268 [Fusarium oxysporum f. sp. albedinis]|nr:Uncharacterized protein HZ326_30268 [Fusarium oxysporum f. sp. albedinis]
MYIDLTIPTVTDIVFITYHPTNSMIRRVQNLHTGATRDCYEWSILEVVRVRSSQAPQVHRQENRSPRGYPNLPVDVEETLLRCR